MSAALQGRVALVVDDAPEALSFLNDALEPAGLTVLLALDGEQALSIVRRMRPDIILLDAVMPNLDGFSTCQRLKLDPQLADVPVIFMTGLSDTESVVRGLDAGGVDYLTKPINPDELIARLSVHLGNADRTRNVRETLDRMGQALISLDDLGREIWISELAETALAGQGASSAVDRKRLYDEVRAWRVSVKQRDARLHLSFNNKALEVILLSDPEESGTLIRLLDPDDKPSSKDLKRCLPVTERESEVLFWVANGKTNREIAEILNMSPRTVNKHLETMFPKLGVENRTAAAAVAIRAMK